MGNVNRFFNFFMLQLLGANNSIKAPLAQHSQKMLYQGSQPVQRAPLFSVYRNNYF